MSGASVCIDRVDIVSTALQLRCGTDRRGKDAALRATTDIGTAFEEPTQVPLTRARV